MTLLPKAITGEPRTSAGPRGFHASSRSSQPSCTGHPLDASGLVTRAFPGLRDTVPCSPRARTPPLTPTRAGPRPERRAEEEVRAGPPPPVRLVAFYRDLVLLLCVGPAEDPASLRQGRK